MAGLFSCQSHDLLAELRVASDQVFPSSVLVIGKVEAWGDGAAEQRKPAAGNQSRALTKPARDDHLRLHAGPQIGTEHNRLAGATRQKLQHLDGIAEVEMENLVALQAVHRRERRGC